MQVNRIVKFKLLKIPNHLIIAGSSWLSKIVIAGVQVASISYLLSILGEEKYAVFNLLTGLLVWCSAVDFGIGTGLQNYISECRAKDPFRRISRLEGQFAERSFIYDWYVWAFVYIL